MDLKQLRYFIAIVDAGSYARAAEGLGITQSALTQSMLRLEASLDARLFERGRFGATLTEAGALLLPRAKLITAESRLAQGELRHSRSSTRARVSIGLGKSVSAEIVHETIRRLRDTMPEVALTVIEGWSPELFNKLLQGEIDFAVSAPLPHLTIDPDLRQEPLFTQTEAVVVGRKHPLAAVAEPSLADLSAHPWLMPPQGNGRIRFLQRIFEDAGVPPPIDFVRSDCIALGLALIRSGDVVAHAILDAVRETLLPDEIRILRFPSLTLERTVYCTVRRRGRLQSAAQRCLAILRHVCPEKGFVLPPVSPSGPLPVGRAHTAQAAGAGGD